MGGFTQRVLLHMVAVKWRWLTLGGPILILAAQMGL